MIMAAPMEANRIKDTMKAINFLPYPFSTVKKESLNMSGVF